MSASVDVWSSLVALVVDDASLLEAAACLDLFVFGLEGACFGVFWDMSGSELPA
jgi:hypothetical protein